MESNFTYTFPAVKGLQARNEYYVAMCPLKLIPKIFLFNEEELPAEYRAQRSLNKARIPQMTAYILENPDEYAFSSLTASIDGEMEFYPITDHDPGIGKLVISMDANILINDGQHRRAAIEEAIKTTPELGNETISVVFFRDRGLQKSQQIFADLNTHAVNSTRSIEILYDYRDDMANLTKDLLNHNNFLNSFTDRENSSLAKYSPKVFTVSSIYNTNCKLVNKGKGTEITSEEKEFVLAFWDLLTDSIYEWKQLQNKILNAANIRSHYLNIYGVVLEAIGMVGYFLFSEGYDWNVYIRKMNQLNWNRNNERDWQGRALNDGGTITKSKVHTILTCNLIKHTLDLPLTPEEEIVEKDFRERQKKRPYGLNKRN